MKKFLTTLMLLVAMMLPWAMNAQLSCDDGASACSITVEMEDDFGDGWNGASLVVMQGTTTRATLTISSGSTNEAVVPVCPGPISFVWSSGDYDGEVIFTIYNADGTVMYTISDASSLSGTFLTDTIECPSCIAPSAFAVRSGDTTGCTLQWNMGDNTDFQIVWSTSSTADPDDIYDDNLNVVLSSDDSAQFANLPSGTLYYFWLRSDCGNDDYSAWMGPVVYNTGREYNMHATGIDTLHNACGYVIYDDGGADGSYSNSANGTLVLIPPAGQFLYV